jgi:hypothetical protein
MKELTVKIPWRNQSTVWWNEICADVVEVFGLPGNRFVYKPYVDHMTFTFNNQKDYNLCRVMLSEHIRA